MGEVRIVRGTEDLHQATKFYVETLGFVVELEFEYPSGRRGRYLRIREGVVLELVEDPGEPVEQTAISLEVRDVDGIHERLRAMDAPVMSGPVDRDWGERDLRFRDTDGLVLVCYTRLH